MLYFKPFLPYKLIWVTEILEYYLNSLQLLHMVVLVETS